MYPLLFFIGLLALLWEHVVLLVVAGGGIIVAAVGFLVVTCFLLHRDLPKSFLFSLLTLALITGTFTTKIAWELIDGFLSYDNSYKLTASYFSWLITLSTFLFGVISIMTASMIRLFIIRLMVLPGSLPVPVQNMFFPPDMRSEARARLLAHGVALYGWKNIKIKSGTKAVLDAAVFQPYPENNKWCIWFLGNGGFYERNLPMFRDHAMNVGVNTIVFNYRGVGTSSGFAFSDKSLYEDGLSVFNYIKTEYNTCDENILLIGHSLGGAIGTYVRMKYPNGPIINDRSFSTLADVPCSWIRRMHLPDTLTCYLVKLISFCVDDVVHFEMNALKSWQNIPSSNIHKHVLYTKDDDIIDYDHASLYKALKQFVSEEKPEQSVYIGNKLKRVPSYGSNKYEENRRRIHAEHKPRRFRIHVPYSSKHPSPHNATLDTLRHPKFNYESHADEDKKQQLNDAAIPRGLSPWDYIVLISKESLELPVSPFITDEFGYCVYKSSNSTTMKSEENDEE